MTFPGIRLPVLPSPAEVIPGSEFLPAGRTLLGDLRADRRTPDGSAGRHLPTTRRELDERGIDRPDVVFVSGDAYVDHPSFANAIIGRLLEALGYRVAILAQPDWRSAEPWRALGRPRLFYAVSAGNMDSMINLFTANRRPRSDDAYSPGGRPGLRPERSTNVYCQRCREAFPGVPVIAGGVEASLRRLAHYDYWSDTVRPSMLVSSKCDLLVHGMGERQVHEIAVRLAAGETVRDLRNMRGVGYLLGAREEPPADAVRLPSFAEVSPPPGAPTGPIREEDLAAGRRRADFVAFARATRLFHNETNPLNARTLVQKHGDRWVVIRPPALPLTQPEMDAVYDLPYLRTRHPSYREKIPADEMIRDSVTIMRGCFGGCTFCSITNHQGRIISSRSQESILRELRTMSADPRFKGTVSDLGGPTANMYLMRCLKPEVEAICRRPSCVHPTVCKCLGTEHGPLVQLMRDARAIPGVKRVNIASGIRMDLARRDPEYMRELAAHHVGGHLKVAPEHIDHRTLDLMKKPGREDFEEFAAEFRRASEQAGKPKQYLVPYFIASHPGSDTRAMIELAVYLKRNGYRPRQVQDFIPAPMDVATCMYYAGLDPMTMQEVTVARQLRDRKMQRALMQFFKPENWYEVRKALLSVGRKDLIGDHCDALIPSRPPREALEARRKAAQRAWARAAADTEAAGPEEPGTPAPADPVERSMAVFGGDLDEGGYIHADGLTPRTNPALRRGPDAPPEPARPAGYRPGRKTARKRRPGE